MCSVRRIPRSSAAATLATSPMVRSDVILCELRALHRVMEFGESSRAGGRWMVYVIGGQPGGVEWDMAGLRV